MKIADFDRLPPAYRSLNLLDGLSAPESDWPGTPLLTKEEHAYYTDAFTRSGWEGGINWYRNFSRNWELSEGLPQEINVPCLMISAADDIVLRPSLTQGMENYIPDLEKHVIPNCGHWTQMEQTDTLNQLMLEWLTRKFG
jgi:pimeloyl-ACP methyl ester carboxylesterase